MDSTTFRPADFTDVDAQPEAGAFIGALLVVLILGAFSSGAPHYQPHLDPDLARRGGPVLHARGATINVPVLAGPVISSSSDTMIDVRNIADSRA